MFVPKHKRPKFVPPHIRDYVPSNRLITVPLLVAPEEAESSAFIKALSCIPAELWSETDGYIGPRTFEEDLHVVNMHIGLPFKDDRCKYVFQAQRCVHSCEWLIDRFNGKLTSAYTSYNALGVEVPYQFFYTFGAHITNTNRRARALQLPGYR